MPFFIKMPSITRLPVKLVSKVPNIFSRVDFPEPDGPIKTSISPFFDKETEIIQN